MRSIRKVAPVALAAALALGVTSCAESERDPSGDEGDGGGTFTFGAAGAPEMFDPFYATDGETFRVTRQMFEGLLEHRARQRRGRARAGQRSGPPTRTAPSGRSRCATT